MKNVNTFEGMINFVVKTIATTSRTVSLPYLSIFKLAYFRIKILDYLLWDYQDEIEELMIDD